MLITYGPCYSHSLSIYYDPKHFKRIWFDLSVLDVDSHCFIAGEFLSLATSKHRGPTAYWAILTRLYAAGALLFPTLVRLHQEHWVQFGALHTRNIGTDWSKSLQNATKIHRGLHHIITHQERPRELGLLSHKNSRWRRTLISAAI